MDTSDPRLGPATWPGAPDAVLRLGSWPKLRAACAPLREQVFMREQGVPSDLEWDEADATALHAAFGPASGPAWATARLLPPTPEGWRSLGRMAVAPAWRRRGLGAWLLAQMLIQARAEDARGVRVSAQQAALGLYARAGFRAEGAVYEEAGIPHRRMVLRLSPPPG